MTTSIIERALAVYRSIRITLKKIAKVEPSVSTTRKVPLEYHGNEGYGGWAVPAGVLNANSTVVDIGLGEDISFSESQIKKYGCSVYGFDPTPKSISFIERLKPEKFYFYPLGLGGQNRKAKFYLPNNPNHVSGAIVNTAHVGANQIEVELIDLASVFEKIGKEKIDVLKMDIEGAEYEVIESEAFAKNASKIHVLCIEMHHRWTEYGPNATVSAVNILNSLGFECVWQSKQSNEEFTFVNKHWSN